MSVVNYRIRDDLMQLLVCLYNPMSDFDRFTIDSMQNYVLDCAWQLENGKNIQRIPFHVTPSRTDADRAIEDMKERLHELKVIALQKQPASEQNKLLRKAAPRL